jgi:hypothetical protein
MKIKIKEQNRAAITAALAKANGRATAHTFNGATPIIEAAVAAETKLKLLGLTQSQRKGAQASLTSGSKVPHSYKYTRITTDVQMLRGATGWFLIGVSTSEGFSFGCGGCRVLLTTEQDVLAVAAFRSSYGVQPIVAAKEVA